MNELIKNKKLLAEFAKAIYMDIQQDIDNYENEKNEFEEGELYK